MGLRKKLISNTFYLFINWFSVTIFSFLYWLIIGKFLSPADYGIVSTSFQIATLLSAISFFGLNSATVKLIPELLQKKKKAKIQGLISFTLKTFSISTSLISIAILLILSFFNFVKLPEEAILFIAFLIPTITFANYLANILYGFQRMKEFAWINSASQATKAFLTFLLIILGMRYLGPLTGLLFSFLLMIFLRLTVTPLTSKKSSLDKELIKKYAIPGFIVIILAQVFANSHFIILSSLTDQTTTGLFAVAFKIASFVMIIPNILNSALFPIISQLSASKGMRSKQAKLISSVFNYSLLFSFPMIIFLSYFSKYAILLFAKQSYLQATQYLPSLLFASLFYGLGIISLNSLYAIKKPEEYRNVFLITVLVYLPLAYLSTQTLSAFGLSLAYLFSTFLFFLLTFWRIRKYLNVRFPWKNFVKILIASFFTFLVTFLIRPYVHSFWAAIPVVVIASFVYVFFLVKLRFHSKDDLTILDFFIEKIPRKMKLIKNLGIKVRSYLSKNVS